MAVLNALTDKDVEFFSQELGPGNAHSWIPAAADRLKKHGVAIEEAIPAIREWFGKYAYRAERPGDDLEKAVRMVYEENPIGRYAPRIKWPEPDAEMAAVVIGGFEPFFDLTPKADPAEVLPQLFAEDELVCYSADLYHQFVAPARDVAACACGQTFIVPSPMRGKAGEKRGGGMSARTLSNVGRRRYLIVEFDGVVGKDRQASLLHFLSLHGALVMAVDSGGKSLHGWFDVEGLADEDVVSFFALAVGLGADPKMWAPFQWCRMPGGRRVEGGRVAEQSIVFYAGRP
jgi:hypothetical protein